MAAQYHCHVFYTNFSGTSDRTLLGLDQLLKCPGFSIYPLSFFFYSPLLRNNIYIYVYIREMEKEKKTDNSKSEEVILRRIV